MKALNSLSQVVVSVTFGSILIKKNPHICKRSTNEIEERGKNHRFIIGFHTHGNFIGTKTDFLRTFKMGKSDIFNLSKGTRNTSSNFDF